MIFSKSLLMFLSIGLLSSFASSIKADDDDMSPSAKIAGYFQKMDDAVQYLQQIQANADPSAPPDFSVAEKGLFKLGKAIDHATHKLKKLDGYLEDDAVASIDASLKDIAANVVTVTQTIKDSKDYSDSQGYTLPTVRVLQTVSAQLTQLFPELMAHVPPDAVASIGYSISVWICSMADAIDYLDEFSADPQTDSFCGLLPPDESYIPTESDFDTIITFPQPWMDCNGSAMAMFYFGYTTGYIALPYADPWCINGIYDWEFYDTWYPTDGEWYVSGSISISSNK